MPANRDEAPRRAAARRASGFTLIELLVVLAILGLLAAIVAPRVLTYLGRAKTDTARVEIKNIETGLDLFNVDVGRYPTQQEGLDALLAAPSGVPSWRGPYLNAKGALDDPWRHPYHYDIPGRHGTYDLYSYGADNAPGGSGDNQDVSNW